MPLGAPSPDHATLNRFHAWLARNEPAALFADVLRFLDLVDPEDPASTPQIADTFALASPAAPNEPALLLLRLAKRLVASWQEAAPAAQQLLTALDLRMLAQFPLLYTRQQRDAALAPAVALANLLVQTLTPALPELAPHWRSAIQAQLDLLCKVVADETSTDAAGQVIERPLGAKGHHRLASAVDPEATFRKHEPKPAVFGGNAAIATTKTRLRAAVLLDGCCADSAAPVALLEQQKAAGLTLPAKMIMDQAAGHGKTRAAVHSYSGGQTEIVARTPQAGGYDASRFGGEDFKLSTDGGSCTCPNGVVSNKVYKSGAGDGVSFRFTAKQCTDCPLWAQCRAPESKPTSQRTVYISPYLGFLRAAAAFNKSAAGKELLAERWQVEPAIAWLVRYDGCRRARRVGRVAAQFHLLQACAVRNLWRWLARVARGQAPLPELHNGAVRP